VIKLHVNGSRVEVDVPPMARLLDVLREDLRLTGSKEGCGEGECGACTVLIDGVATNSCLVPVCQVQGTELTTVEGLAKDDRLAAVQQAFITHGAAQCGICTPGFLVTAHAFLKNNPRPTRMEVREGLAGNLCRCTGYQKIIDAVQVALAEGGRE
jgi:carbon-monoxide dehydrogenase small subunit